MTDGKATAEEYVAMKSGPATSGLNMSQRLCHIEQGNMRFIIMDAPSDANIGGYIEALKKKNCKLVIRACEPTYKVQTMMDAGIEVMDIPFPDGDSPPERELRQFLDLVHKIFSNKSNTNEYVAVHCVAGLGRAPVLVTIALVESGMKPDEAVSYIRKKRRGAINQKQLNYVYSYKSNKPSPSCCVML